MDETCLDQLTDRMGVSLKLCRLSGDKSYDTLLQANNFKLGEFE